jgi:undecaprenyl-diphosphatase
MHPLELWQAVVLGLVEGITEYLPVSSTGHLIITSQLLGLTDPRQESALDAFEIVIQGGAILAVLGLYWPSVVRMLRGLLGKDPQGFKLLVNLFIAFLPAAIIGLILEKWIERHLFHAGPVILAFGLGGLYMMGVDLWREGRLGKARMWPKGEMEVWDVSPKQALMIGLLQCLSMWPGTSRSLMTISGGIFAGLRPKQAAQFSFLLGLPTLGAATVYKLAKNLHESHKTGEPDLFHQLGVGACVLGIVVAAVSAAVAIKWLISFLTRHGLTPFGWYRIALCVVLLGLSWAGFVSISKPGPELNGGTKVVPPVKWVEPPPAPPTPK